LGWSVGLPAITRRTEKGIPTYDGDHESDVFVLSGSEDLVPIVDYLGKPERCLRKIDGVSYIVIRYRPRVEGLYERWVTADTGGDARPPRGPRGAPVGAEYPVAPGAEHDMRAGDQS
jgi:hypothetical protein